jgi:phosphoserine aminotransferase
LNFNAGPGILPKKVMLKAQKEFLDTNNSGLGVIEMSHR